jgi:UDP-hydrolysing UDP-N-acetyl-D-glucosamine 2-epimerase
VRRRKIAVLTTSRADYGLLSGTIARIDEDPALELQLLACGSHWSPAHGRTADEISADGRRVAARVDTLPKRDTPAGVAAAIGRGVQGFASAFARLKPDILLVLGDRYELLAACSAAVGLRLPIAHIHGGESTEGALDEQVRHAVSKMAHLHFPAAEPYRRRLIRMGERPDRVFNVGAPGIEALHRVATIGRKELEGRLGFSLAGPLALVTVHPTTLAGGNRDGVLESVLGGLERAGMRSVLTFANADAGGRAINERIRGYARRRPARALAVPSLGHEGYMSLMGLADVVVGNSSSGLIEAPTLGLPTINVGTRQDGRLRAPSVIDCAAKPDRIARALRRALSPAFRRSRCRGRNPYGSGRSSELIVNVLKTAPFGEELLFKRFYDGA